METQTIAVSAAVDDAALGAPAATLAQQSMKREPVWIRRGTSEYRRAGWALFLVGFATFSQIYCVQPLLPAFASTFGVGPAESSLALSLTTGLLAFSIVMAGAFSQSLGRRGLMFGCMTIGALFNLAASVTPSWHGLLVVRALEGLTLGGVPAVAMAYLAEEIEPGHLGRTMGLYIAGNAFGAMIGRVGMGLIAGIASWRVAMGALGLLCLLAAVGFFLLAPRPRNFVRQPGFSLRVHANAWGNHLRNSGLVRVFATGFLLTSVFVTLFNYTTFRLSEAPYHLGQTAISTIFLVYGVGIVSSTIAGALGDRFGRQPLLAAGFLLMAIGISLTLAHSLIVIAAGVTLVTTGFFVAHAVASASVGPLAKVSKGHAASLYLLFYYTGSSVTGSVGGWFWQHGGWPWVAILTGTAALAGMALALAPLLQPDAGHSLPKRSGWSLIRRRSPQAAS